MFPCSGFMQVMEDLDNCHFVISFFKPEIEVWVMESHEKAIDILKMNSKNQSKVEKTTDKSENQLIPVKK